MYEKKPTARYRFPVLVCDAHERMSLAVIRSLGRAGYPVHACSPHAYAAGFRSAGTAAHAVCPPAAHRSFVPWLREYCRAHGIRCVVPTEPVLLAIRPVFDEFAARLPMSSDETTVFRGINKFDLFDTLLADGASAAAGGLPPLIKLRRGDAPPTESSLAKLGFPVFIKTDGSYSVDGDSATLRARTAAEAQDLIGQLQRTTDRLVVQGNVPGTGVGAFALRWNGRILAKFMHLRLHEIPSRGWSSMSLSWMNDGIMDDAIARLEQLDWQGVAMMEYRWNPADERFALIEMNGRFWGSLHLPLYAGVDFPALLLDAFRGVMPDETQTTVRDVVCRDAILDLKYTWSRCRSRDVAVIDKLRAVFDYVRNSLDPQVRSTLLFPGDRQVSLFVWWQYVARWFERRRAGSNPDADPGVPQPESIASGTAEE